MAFNGAEPVSPATIERFAERFAPYGLRPDAIDAGIRAGRVLGRAGLPAAGPGPAHRPHRPRARSCGRGGPTRRNRATPDALRFVACGQPLPGHEIRIVDAAGHELGDRREGRIEFRGPSATAGYFRNADATRSLFHDDWLDTGDLGYLADADLYVTGRVKDLIIRAGRNLHPDELEEAVGNLAGVRKGCVAVFACPDPGGGVERLVVMAETRATGDEATAALRSEIVSTTVDLLGVAPDDVVLAPPRTVPKTSSGKIRRAASREIYEQGQDRCPTAGAVVGVGSPPAPRSCAVVAPRPPRGGRCRVRRLRVGGVRGPRGAGNRPAGAAAPGAVALADSLLGRSGSWPASPGRRSPCTASTTSQTGPRSSWPTIRAGSTGSRSPRCCRTRSASLPARCCSTKD